MTPLAGGYSGETYLAEAAGERSVVRIYGQRSAQRGPAAVEMDASVLRLVRGLLPVPEVLEARPPAPGLEMPALLVTSFLPGERGDLLLARAEPDLAAAAGRALAQVVLVLRGIAMLRPGMFVDGDLRVGPFPEGGDDLGQWVAMHLAPAVTADWSAQERAGLDALVEEAASLTDPGERTCLVHADLNPKNVLLDPATGAVTGVVDWEFAHAGSPWADLGNLERFTTPGPFREALLAPVVEAVGEPEDSVVRRARAADLWALADGARATSPQVRTTCCGRGRRPGPFDPAPRLRISCRLRQKSVRSQT